MQIQAQIIKDSILPNGTRLTTMQVDMPRFILPEFSKHRVFSLSAQSTRAVPVKKLVEMVRNTPFIPLYWGANQKGMTANQECNEYISIVEQNYEEKCVRVGLEREDVWREAAFYAARYAEAFDNAGYHKQTVGRLIEPFIWQRCIVTSTEWDNFYRLRLHKDSQPEIRILAEKMKKAHNNSVPRLIKPGQWHIPFDEDVLGETKENTIKYSAAKCASSSYRTEKLELSKALEIFEKLVIADPKHEVPLEHIAMSPIIDGFRQIGYTHTDREGNMWSGNLKHWVQYRQIYAQESRKETG